MRHSPATRSSWLLDGVPLAVRAARTERSESGVAVTLEFDRATGSRLSIRSDVPKRLANGHRELLTVRAPDGSVVLERLLDAQSGDVAVDLAAIAARRQAAGEFFGLGLRHILGGYDHLLFLVALLLGVRRLRSVVTTVTAFTLAHSVTLSLAVLGLVAAPPAIVEPLIAASIVFVGIENLVRDPGASRWKLTFAFGLVHGFGFAGALRDLGIGTDGAGVALPLACFNVGVEAGQIAVVVGAVADSPRAERQAGMAPQVRAGDIARHHRRRRLLAGGANDAAERRELPYRCNRRRRESEHRTHNGALETEAARSSSQADRPKSRSVSSVAPVLRF